MADKFKTKSVVVTKTYRNVELGEWIDSAFGTEPERVAAWHAAFHIAEMYPEIKERIRGELIDEDIQEEPWDSQ